jgi:hypothetical protein
MRASGGCATVRGHMPASSAGRGAQRATGRPSRRTAWRRRAGRSTVREPGRSPPMQATSSRRSCGRRTCCDVDRRRRGRPRDSDRTAATPPSCSSLVRHAISERIGVPTDVPAGVPRGRVLRPRHDRANGPVSAVEGGRELSRSVKGGEVLPHGCPMILKLGRSARPSTQRKQPLTCGIVGVSDGARTRDNRDHNPVLYQLSYTHHGAAESIAAVPTSAAAAELVTTRSGWREVPASCGRERRRPRERSGNRPAGRPPAPRRCRCTARRGRSG